jgi:hypothetical protein
VINQKGRGVLDTPLEPVIGLAEGETRWRGMTTVVVVLGMPKRPASETDLPDGQITRVSCPVLFRKIFRFSAW